MTRTITQRSPRTSAKPRRRRAKPEHPAKTSASIKSYRAALSFVNNRTNYEKLTRISYTPANFNLSRMQRLLTGLGNPHKKLRTIHVAGTKGKGSTCHMLAAMLQNCGLKIGLFTSPHFLDLRERIAVNGKMVTESEFTKLIATIAPVAEKLKRDEPTFFEMMTAAAFLHFVDQEVDFAVIETGLGGRLDSTNLIKPDVCAVTNISYDHVAQLGTTLEEIAEEKAGIFKPNVPVISAPQPPSVKRVLKEAARKVGCEIYFIGDDLEFSFRFESSRLTGPQTRICMATATSRFDHVHVPLLGEHQAYNCGVALGLVDVLRRRGIAISEQDAVEGLAKVQIEGRLELIRQEPRTVVDAAHNAASIAALMRGIGQNINYDSMVVIFGCSADKDIEGMLKQLQLGADKVVFTNIGTPRAVDPNELHARFLEKTHKMAQVAPTLREAYQIACNCVTREDVICITGSVHLVGEAKRLLASAPTDLN